MKGDDAGPGVVATVDVIRDFLRLRRQIRVLLLVRHAPGGGDRHDYLGLAHRLVSGSPAALQLGLWGTMYEAGGYLNNAAPL
jgi:hypothetical protein